MSGHRESLGAHLTRRCRFLYQGCGDLGPLSSGGALEPLQFDHRQGAAFGGRSWRDGANFNLLADLGNLEAGRDLGSLDVGGERVRALTARRGEAGDDDKGEKTLGPFRSAVHGGR